MDKSHSHQHIETVVFNQLMTEHYKRRDALDRAAQYRLLRSLPLRRRSLYWPIRRRLGNWLVNVGTRLQDHEINPARLDTVEQV